MVVDQDLGASVAMPRVGNWALDKQLYLPLVISEVTCTAGADTVLQWVERPLPGQ